MASLFRTVTLTVATFGAALLVGRCAGTRECVALTWRSPNVVDLGSVPVSRVLSQTFSLRNDSVSPVVITHLTRSCTCQTVAIQIDGENVETDAEIVVSPASVMDVQLAFSPQPGEGSYSVTFLDSRERRYVAGVNCRGTRDIEIRPPVLRLGSLGVGEIANPHFVIYAATGHAFAPVPSKTEVRPTESGILGEVEVVQLSHHTASLRARIVPPGTFGVFGGVLRLTDSLHRTVDVPFHGRIDAGLRVSPAEVLAISREDSVAIFHVQWNVEELGRVVDTLPRAPDRVRVRAEPGASGMARVLFEWPRDIETPQICRCVLVFAEVDYRTVLTVVIV